MNKVFNCKKGATAMEYALIAALISIVIVLGLSVVSTSLDNTYSSLGSSLEQTQ